MSIPRQAASVHSILAGQPWTCSPLSRNCKAFLQAHSRVRARAIWLASDAKKGMEEDKCTLGGLASGITYYFASYRLLPTYHRQPPDPVAVVVALLAASLLLQ